MSKPLSAADAGTASASSACSPAVVLTREQLRDAAMVLVTVDAGPFQDLDAAIRLNAMIQRYAPHDVTIAFMRPGESIAAFSEIEMAKVGWVRKPENNSFSGRRPASGSPSTGSAG